MSLRYLYLIPRHTGQELMPVVRLAHALSKTGELRIQQRDNSNLSFSFYFLFESGSLLFYDNIPSLS